MHCLTSTTSKLIASMPLVGFLLLAIPAFAADEPFARVGETTLSVADFDLALNKTIRSRFYHGAIPEGELAEVRKRVAEDLINRTLLLSEAERRGIDADETAIQATLAQYDRRYASNPRWQEEREKMLAKLAQDLREEERLTRLEDSVRRVAPPTQEQVRQYYATHPQAFTEPQRLRVSLILLAVDPSASGQTWDAAFEEAKVLTRELDQGASFEELAHLHSADASAQNGGDMGYLHEGMLGDGAQQTLDALPVGAHSTPVRVLEGVAILKLTERTSPHLREFVDVRQRAQELWLREQGDLAWTQLIEQLRNSTTITVYQPQGIEQSI